MLQLEKLAESHYLEKRVHTGKKWSEGAVNQEERQLTLAEVHQLMLEQQICSLEETKSAVLLRKLLEEFPLIGQLAVRIDDCHEVIS